MPVQPDAEALDVLLNRVSTISWGTTVGLSYPNIDYAPVANRPFAAMSQLKVPTYSPTLNADGYQKLSGIFQVSVFTPTGTGALVGARLAQKVLDSFTRGLRLVGDNVTVEIGPEAPSMNTPLQEEAWWQQPISISWFVILS